MRTSQRRSKRKHTVHRGWESWESPSVLGKHLGHRDSEGRTPPDDRLLTGV